MLKTIDHKYIVAIIYTCVLFLDRLDLTIVNIALPNLAHYFNVSITQTEWISNAFLLALAMSIPISGWIGDRFGIKNVFIAATTLFGTCSFLCAFAPNFTCLVILRFFEGIGGGIIIPVGMTMLYRVFQPSEYASITSFTFLPALIAPAFGPALGGIIIHFLHWQWIFLLLGCLCFAAVFSSLFVLQNYAAQKTQSLDAVGFLLAASIMILVLSLLSDFGKYGLSSSVAIMALLVVVLIFSFIKYENSIMHPLIDLRLFNNKLFTQSNLIQCAFQICHYASFFTISLYLQVGVGMSALTAGMIVGMQAIGAMCVNRFSVKLFHRYGPSITIMIGFVGTGFFAACLLLITRADLFWLCGMIMFCRGLFSGIGGIPTQITSMLGFDKSQLGQVSAVYNAGRQVAITLGIALASFLISYSIKQQDGVITIKVFHDAFYLIFIAALFGIYIASRIDNKKALILVGE